MTTPKPTIMVIGPAGDEMVLGGRVAMMVRWLAQNRHRLETGNLHVEMDCAGQAVRVRLTETEVVRL